MTEEEILRYLLKSKTTRQIDSILETLAQTGAGWLIAFAVIALVLSLCMAWAIIDTGQRHSLHNPYWPFTVETVIHDR